MFILNSSSIMTLLLLFLVISFETVKVQSPTYKFFSHTVTSIGQVPFSMSKHSKSGSVEARSGPEVVKLFFVLNSAEHEIMNFFLLINVKMPTIVGILTFMSRKK